MTRKPSHTTLKAVGLLLALAMFAPAAVQAANQTDTGTGHGGLDWRLPAIMAGTLIGLFLLGIWGDVVVGAVFLGAASLVGYLATLVTRTPWRGERSSDSRVLPGHPVATRESTGGLPMRGGPSLGRVGGSQN